MSDLTRKTLTATVRAVSDSDEIEFVLSSGAPDRDDDTINVNGWQLGSYRRNPVVLYGHDYGSLPVAKCTDIQVRAGQLVARAAFVPGSVFPFAQQVYQMLKGGYLNACSVGFRPLVQPVPNEHGGFAFASQELVEFSIVPVPAHPGALVVGRGLREPDAAAVQKWLSASARETDPVLLLQDDDVALELADELPAVGRGSRRAHQRVKAGRVAVRPSYEPVLDILDAPEVVHVDRQQFVEAVKAARPELEREVRRQAGPLIRNYIARELKRLRGRVD